MSRLAFDVPFPGFRHGFSAGLKAGKGVRSRGERLDRGFQQTLHALDVICTSGVILLDEHWCVWFLNAEARRITRAGDGLAIDGNSLIALTSRSARELAEAMQRLRTFGASSVGPLLIERKGAEHPYQLSVVPEAIVTIAGRPRSGALLNIIDPDRKPALCSSVFEKLFGLTAAEAALAVALANGIGLADHASAANVTLNTVRSQLKKVFEKTGTHRQGELVALLLRSCLV